MAPTRLRRGPNVRSVFPGLHREVTTSLPWLVVLLSTWGVARASSKLTRVRDAALGLIIAHLHPLILLVWRAATFSEFLIVDVVMVVINQVIESMLMLIALE